MWSTLSPAGADAVQVSRLLWAMVIGGAAIWLLVAALLLHARRDARARWSERSGVWLIVGGGVLTPLVVLSMLLAAGMPLLSEQLAPAPAGSLRVHVEGEQWWWRVRYEDASGRSAELANELRLPLGQTTEILLSSADVIHSFWIPSLSGKVDMLPGRVTRLTLEPQQLGTFGGNCAEYCGTSHAKMRFAVQVVDAVAFTEWLDAQSRPAASATDGLPRFSAAGCAACHAIRGTSAASAIGPDLTHMGSRLTIGAGTLPNTFDNMVRWIADPHTIKPDVLMPAFGGLSQDELGVLAAYLQGLR